MRFAEYIPTPPLLVTAGTKMIYYVHNKVIGKYMINGLKLTHIATDYPQDLPLNGKEMQLAMDNSDMMNESWSLMCESVMSRLGIEIEGNFEIDYIVLNGQQKVFH